MQLPHEKVTIKREREVKVNIPIDKHLPDSHPEQ